jgi:hypothetical protein
VLGAAGAQGPQRSYGGWPKREGRVGQLGHGTEPGTFDLHVGPSSGDLPLHTAIEIPGS